MQSNSPEVPPSATDAPANMTTGETTFTVHGIPFASIESFAQAIKLPPDDHRKASVAMMNRNEAKAFRTILAAESNGRDPEFIYWRGQSIAFGSQQHTELMSFAARQYQISIGNLPRPKLLVANVVSSSSQYGNVSNFALTPFSLDGQSFASVESFIQYIKYRPDDDRRTLVPNLFGVVAKRAGSLINREIYPVCQSQLRISHFRRVAGVVAVS